MWLQVIYISFHRIHLRYWNCIISMWRCNRYFQAIEERTSNQNEKLILWIAKSNLQWGKMCLVKNVVLYFIGQCNDCKVKNERVSCRTTRTRHVQTECRRRGSDHLSVIEETRKMQTSSQVEGSWRQEWRQGGRYQHKERWKGRQAKCRE